jgi:hypothetical protein
MLGIALGADSSASAQGGGARPWNDCVAAEIQARLVSQQPLRLSAQRVSLEGDTLRLTGQASIAFGDTTVQAEEIVIDQSSKQVALTTVRKIFIGARSRCAPPPSSRPRIEYR